MNLIGDGRDKGRVYPLSFHMNSLLCSCGKLVLVLQIIHGVQPELLAAELLVHPIDEPYPLSLSFQDLICTYAPMESLSLFYIIHGVQPEFLTAELLVNPIDEFNPLFLSLFKI